MLSMKKRSSTTVLLLIWGSALIAAYVAAWRLGDLRARTAAFEVVFFVAFALYAFATMITLQADTFPTQADPARRQVDGVADQSPVSAGQTDHLADTLRDRTRTSFCHIQTAGVFVAAAAMMAPLLFTRPALSDDMYRYVWDGRVQAHGISPYRYPPDAPALTALRDTDIWPNINRKSAVTIYPPVAELGFALLWRIWPDSVRWFQIAMGFGALLAGGLLLGLLRDLGR